MLWLRFFLKLLVMILHSSLTAYWTPFNFEGLTFESYISAFHIVMGFLWQEQWSGWPLPPPVENVLSELFTLTHPSLVVLHSMAHQFIDLSKLLLNDTPVIHEFIFIWRIIALQHHIGFATYHHKLAIGICMSLPVETPSHLPPFPTLLSCQEYPLLPFCVHKGITILIKVNIFL